MRWKRFANLFHDQWEVARFAAAKRGDEVGEMVEVVEWSRAEVLGRWHNRDAGEDIYKGAGDVEEFFNLWVAMLVRDSGLEATKTYQSDAVDLH